MELYNTEMMQEAPLLALPLILLLSVLDSHQQFLIDVL